MEEDRRETETEYELRLCQAEKNGDLLTVSDVLCRENDSLREHTTYGSYLTLAAQHGHKHIVEWLVEAGADVNRRGEDGSTPLMAAVDCGCVDVVTVLIDANADVNAKDNDGNTALIIAARNKHSVQIMDFLISRGADMNLQNTIGRTAAMVCVINSNFDCLKILFEKGANFDLVDASGSTVHNVATDSNVSDVLAILLQCQFDGSGALHAAIDNNSFSSVNLLLFCNFVVECINKHVPCDRTPLYAALHKGVAYGMRNRALVDEEIIKLLIVNGAQVDPETIGRGWMLALAAESGRIGVVELLLSHGANINYTNRGYDAPLICAATRGHKHMLSYLIDKGADVNVTSGRSGWWKSAAIFALEHHEFDCAELLLERGTTITSQVLCCAGELKNQKGLNLISKFIGLDGIFNLLGDNVVYEENIVTFLLEIGMDANAVSKSGKTPLMLVRREETANILIKHGASVNKLGSQGESALLEVLSKYADYNTDMPFTLEHGMVKLLLDNDADINVTDEKGNTALMLAASKGRPDMVDTLIQAGSDINQRNLEGHTALLLADMNYCEENVETLLKHGAAVDVQNHKKGKSALMIAASCESSLPLVHQLIASGADVNAEDKDGNTALHFGQFPDTAGVLLAAGADINKKNAKGRTPLVVVAWQFAMWNAEVKDEYEVLISVPKVRTLFQCFMVLVENGVIDRNEHESALSALLVEYLNCDYAIRRDLRKHDFQCVQALLTAGMGKYSSTHCNAIVAKLISHDKPDLVEICVKFGLGPTQICFKCLVDQKCLSENVLELVTNAGIGSASPLAIALLYGNIQIAQYFVDTLFLTQSDVDAGYMDTPLYSALLEAHLSPITEFLHQLHSQPFSLFQISFLAVSHSLGSGLEREEKLRRSGLPMFLQKKLLFDNNYSVETLSELRHSGHRYTDYDPDALDYDSDPNVEPQENLDFYDQDDIDFESESEVDSDHSS